MIKKERQFFKKGLNLVLICFSALFFLLSNLPQVQAAGATFFLSPAKGNYTVGATFNVSVMIASGGGVGINAGETTVSFTKDILAVNSVSQTGSIFELWTAKPTFSNTTGKISFGGGLTDAYTGTAGKVVSISFRALKEGTGQVTFANSIITARDGLGTDIFSGAGSGSFTIGPKTGTEKPKEEPKKPAGETTTPASGGPLPPPPEITSSSHPNQKDWYAANKVSFEWKLLPSIIGTSMALTEDASTTPNTSSDGVNQGKTYDKVADGKHYFHLRLQNSSGWGPAAHRQILVDVTPPDKPQLTLDNGGDATDPTPLLKILTADKTSGLGKVKIAAGELNEELEPRDFIAAPYEFKRLAPGNYQVLVTALDKAGNFATSTLSFSVDPLKPPVITDIPKSIDAGQNLTVRGVSFYPKATLEVYIALGNVDPVKGETQTDENGDWNYFHNGKLKVGDYQVWAKIIDSRGAQSLPSTKAYVTVLPLGIVAAYGWYIIIVLLFIIVLLVLYIFYLKRTYYEEKLKIQAAALEAQKKLSEVFAALHEEVDELIVYADKKAGLSESERRIKEKIKEALDISEEFINKEIEDIEKQIVMPKKKKK